MKRLKICFFCEVWESGGIESFINSVIEKIDFDRFEVDVVAAKIGDSVFTDGLISLGVKFFELSGRTRCFKNHKEFKHILATRKYDVIHFNLFQAFAFLYIKQAMDAGVAVRIAHAHGAGLRKSPLSPLKLLLHRLGRRIWGKSVTHKLACSSLASEFLFAADADEIIKNGIEADRFSFSEDSRGRVREALGIKDGYVIGHVGRFDWEKNQSFLIRVLSHLRVLVPEARLLLVGDGEMKEELMSLSHKLKLSDSVIFYGTTDDVPSLMSAMDVFVFPSFMEGLGIVAIEAQASGLPVLCSEAIPSDAFVTDLPERLNLSDGEDVWALKIKDILEKHTERTSRVQEINEAGFTSKSSVSQLMKYYSIPLS